MKIRDICQPGGYFVLNPGGPYEEVLKNTWVKDGADLALQSIFQAQAVFAAAFHLGLTGASYTYESATLASINASEPAGNGYARQSLTRNTTDWSVSLVNGVMRAASKIVTFTASANWDKTWSRMFICDQTASKVISLSGATPTPRTVLAGQGPPIQYFYYLSG